ncbi:hypothetical protein CBS101457_002766 [Exobasidium rhododendri]|nr:hypothetical protein CBS101457_002766 [Exobasidium rhododendri]
MTSAVVRSDRLPEEKLTAFAEASAEFSAKLKIIEGRKIFLNFAEIPVLFKKLCTLAASLDELRECLIASCLWTATGDVVRILPKPSLYDCGALNSRCYDLGYPELAFYSFMNQEETGYVYSEKSLKILQRQLLVKSNTCNKLGGTEGLAKLQESEALLEGLLEPIEDDQAIESMSVDGQGKEEEQQQQQLLLAQLSLIDPILTISGTRPSPILTIDVVCIMQGIKSVIDVYGLCERPLSRVPLLGRQLQLRLQALFQLLIREAPYTLNARERRLAFFFCEVYDKTMEFFEVNESLTEFKESQPDIVAVFEDLMRLVPWKHIARYRSQKGEPSLPM